MGQQHERQPRRWPAALSVSVATGGREYYCSHHDYNGSHDTEGCIHLLRLFIQQHQEEFEISYFQQRRLFLRGQSAEAARRR